MAGKSSRRVLKVVRALHFESFTEENESENKLSVSKRESRNNKRKYDENNECSSVDAEFECLNAALTEKRKYLEQFVTGSKQAHDEEVKKLLTLCDNNFKNFKKVYQNIKDLKKKCTSDFINSEQKDQEFLNSFDEFVSSVKQKRDIFKDAISSYEKIHNVFSKDASTFEEDYQKQCSESLNHLSKDLQEIQRSLHQQVQKKAKCDMKKNLKQMLSNCFKEITNMGY